MPQLVICADDFAFSDSVSQAICELAQLKRISATSVMTLSPSWPAHSQALLVHQHQLDVGLHLDWTSHFALGRGHGKALLPLMVSSLIGLNSLSHRLKEIQNTIHYQLDLFEKYWGKAPSYIDGHQHVHQFKGIREALISVLKQRYPSNQGQEQTPYLRISQPVPEQQSIKSDIIACMGAQNLIELAEQESIAFFGFLSGIYDLKPGAISYADRMKIWLSQVNKQPTILMCHPGVNKDKDDAISDARVMEYEYLKSNEFLSDLDEYNIHITKAHKILYSE